jgi:hypothetical protein
MQGGNKLKHAKHKARTKDDDQWWNSESSDDEADEEEKANAERPWEGYVSYGGRRLWVT